MSFPLAEWIDAHPDVPHHLSHSGMLRSLRTLGRALRDRPEPDPEALRESLGRLYGVPAARVFLSHGASEANALVLQYHARSLSRSTGRAPRLYTPRPEYPPIPDAGRLLGFRPVASPDSADLVACSAPRNPEGTRRTPSEIERWAGEGRALLVDQTFREFTDDPAWTRRGLERLWLTGSFTKIYGADALRVGYAIAPEPDRDAFAELHGLLLNKIPDHSITGARAILAHREAILAEARALFRRNVDALRSTIEGVPPLAAPVWFDRGRAGLDGDRLAQAALRAGVLVCAGSFFGEPRGVRICLTRRSFPADLAAYERVRARFLE